VEVVRDRRPGAWPQGEAGLAYRDDAALHPVADELDGEEGIARRPGVHGGRQVVGQPEDLTGESGPVLGRQRRHLEGRGARQRQQRAQGLRLGGALGESLVPHGQQEQHGEGSLLPALHQVACEIEGLGPPLHVVEQDHHGPLAGQELDVALQEGEALRGRLRRAAGSHEVRQAGPFRRVGHLAAAQQGLRAVEDLQPRQAGAAQMAAHHPWQSILGSRVGAVVGPQHDGAANLVGPLGEPLGEVCLAVARHAAQHDEARLALGVHPGERPPELGPLHPPAEEGDRAQAIEAEPRADQLEGRFARDGVLPCRRQGR